jgi:hypothetical protein
MSSSLIATQLPANGRKRSRLVGGEVGSVKAGELADHLLRWKPSGADDHIVACDRLRIDFSPPRTTSPLRRTNGWPAIRTSWIVVVSTVNSLQRCL